MSDTDLGTEDKSAKGVLFSLVSDGDWMFHKGEYKKAIDSYMKTLSVKPDDRSCYVGISKCHLFMGNPEMALREAENSLRGDRTYFEGLYRKAEALYYMGEFEFAKVCYHRGLKIRPEVQEFRVGIQKAQEAIENAAGSPESVKLENKGGLGFFRKDDEVRRKYPATAIQQMMAEKKVQTTAKTRKNEKKHKQVLGEFYDDKKYLEDLLKDKDLRKVITKKGQSLADVIEGSLGYLETCTEFRSSEKPIAPPKVRKPPRSKSGSKSGSEHVRLFRKRLDEIESELACGDAKAALKKAEDAMRAVRAWPAKGVADRDEFVQMLHRCMGNARYKLGDTEEALDHYRRDLELATQRKHHGDRSRALDNMGRVHAEAGHWERAIECQEKRLPLVHEAAERAWMFYELGCWHLELKRFQEARKYGLRCVAAADDAGDVLWQMNSNVLVAQSEVKLGDCESSIRHFEKALSYAKKQDDDSATNAIKEALDEAKRRLTQNDVPL
ncbi:outer dynein arm-docking complex subunit 4 [Eucyclogobius newberryi]|uniref:outer dynein arm-docking complex subunit 4 n=1 Tax=Eucyclogobius newberryi TaxID=166745 RepID=UPI003B592B7D